MNLVFEIEVLQRRKKFYLNELNKIQKMIYVTGDLEGAKFKILDILNQFNNEFCNE